HLGHDSRSHSRAHERALHRTEAGHGGPPRRDDGDPALLPRRILLWPHRDLELLQFQSLSLIQSDVERPLPVVGDSIGESLRERRVATREDAVRLTVARKEPAGRVVVAAPQPRDDRVLHPWLDLTARRDAHADDLTPP